MLNSADAIKSYIKTLNIPVSLKIGLLSFFFKKYVLLLCFAFLIACANLTLKSPYRVVRHLTEIIVITVLKAFFTFVLKVGGWHVSKTA